MTAKERQYLIDYLFAEKCSCVIRNGNDTGCFTTGVSRIYSVYSKKSELFSMELSWRTRW